jgi:hypothetical protein
VYGFGCCTPHPFASRAHQLNSFLCCLPRFWRFSWLVLTVSLKSAGRARNDFTGVSKCTFHSNLGLIERFFISITFSSKHHQKSRLQGIIQSRYPQLAPSDTNLPGTQIVKAGTHPSRHAIFPTAGLSHLPKCVLSYSYFSSFIRLSLLALLVLHPIKTHGVKVGHPKTLRLVIIYAGGTKNRTKLITMLLRYGMPR